MEGLLTFKTEKERSGWGGEWMCFTLSDPLICLFSPNTFLAPHWCGGPPASPGPSEPCRSPGLLAQRGAQAQSLFDATLSRALDLSDPLSLLSTLLLQ